MSGDKSEAGTAEAPATGWAASKATGNACYKAGSYESAADAYSAALAFDDVPDADRATLLCNRAQSRLMLKLFDKAVEDCTAVLAIDKEHVKGLFRRATAYEALGKQEEALADFKEVRRLQPSVAAAASAVRRIEAAMRGAGGAGSSFGAAAGRGTGRKVTKEDMAALQELEERVRSVATQLKKAKEQAMGASSGRRRLELTQEELKRVEDGTNVYEAVGKMFVLTPLTEVKSNLSTKIETQDKRLKTIEGSIEYLQKAQKEADNNWMEMVQSIRGTAA